MTPPLAPRRIPRQSRALATRAAILEAAAHIIAGGLAAFNTNAVAARAGVSIGSLYQYFPKKDALMLALIAERQARQVATVAQALAGLPSYDDALEEAGALVAGLLARFPGEIAPTAPEVAARTLPGLVRAVVDIWANCNPPQLDRTEDEAVRAALGYLTCRPG
ncbi:TetR/AcrR family transcriptional regulator [Erythrobacter sp. NE805]|uniref:TetR/AcrR family transcriptional regulator n=1 Tax=Erythrobacter sp. NE805 TaxID=3389875 RepID=UPI00396AFDDF